MSRHGRRVVFWRHGRTSWNSERRFQGQTDVPLDEVGIQQAVTSARLLSALQPALIVCSDLERACATAEALGALTGLTPEVDIRLRETYAAQWEGMAWPDIEAAYGDDALRWSSDPWVRPGVTGETRVEVAARVVAAVEEWLGRLESGQTLVVATHGGAARAGIAQMLALPHDRWEALGVLTNCAWSVLVENTGRYGQGWRLQEYNAGTLPAPALADDR